MTDLLPEEQEIAPHGGVDKPESPITDLTLWEVLVQGVRRPRAIWRAFWLVVGVPDEMAAQAAPVLPEIHEDESERRPAAALPSASTAGAVPAAFEASTPVGQASVWPRLSSHEALIPLGLMAIGLALTLLGSGIMASGTNRNEANELHRGAPWLLMGFFVWLVAGGLAYRRDLRAWWQRIREGGFRVKARTSGADITGAEQPVTAPVSPGWRHWITRLETWAETHAARIALTGLGMLLSLAAYIFNSNNTFTAFGVFVWVSSIVVWLAVLTPADFDAVAWVEAKRGIIQRLLRREIRFRFSWTALALLAIMLVAAYFRFARLGEVPPEMTSDHVEKLLDAQRVLDGTYQVFFPNNGGREGLQMYLVALFGQVSGLGMQFLTLKWVSVLEGLLTIPVLWWMGREVIGEEQRELGNVVGLLLAALVAVSYWHVALSRLALRIVLTPLIMALVMGYLARAMRYNRRGDFLKAGVALGVGMYCYQAVRMIPVVIMLGVGLVVLFRARTWVDRRRYLVNFAALVLISLVIFVPLGRFMIDFPDLFWMRTSGRLFGDDIITETDPITGVVTERDASLGERLEAFGENLPVLGSNIRNALLMYNWKGDVAWINGAPNEPEMDIITGSLLILGLAVWLVRMFRRRDVVDWLILPAVFIMLLPSALSIAFPVENPSATRTSGTLPLVYLVAAYGLAMLLYQFEKAFRGRAVRVVSVGLAVVLVWGAFGYNSRLYFGRYLERYRVASLPYSTAGRVLRGFAESNGSYGNAFMVAYPYWMDHRAIGIEAGRIDWPNGLLSIYDLPQQIRDNMANPEYAFDPDRAVLFFYNQSDQESPVVLQQWFPQGNSILQSTGDELKDFYTFIAPPPGEEWLQQFLAEHE